MKSPKIPSRTILSTFIAAIGVSPYASAAPIDLAQYPSGSAVRRPIPNVIVTVDNSGSMGAPGIAALQDALRATFQPNIRPDRSLRLAYQAMWGCNTIPSNSADCSSNGVSWNTMRVLEGDTATPGTHRGEFYRWINTLNAAHNTPTHAMMQNAGEYYRTTGANSPWNRVPGTADNNPLSCRRAYHVLMTDGGWNNDPTNTLGNVDGTARTLPDPQAPPYSITSNETRIYRDPWGYATPWMNGGNVQKPISTLSDMAFHYWATDLQPNLTNNVRPLIDPEGTGDRVFSSGSASQTISEYWNPRNDPATWQHMMTYTIGYNDAASWPNINSNPIFNVAQGMYGGDYTNTILGTKAWRNPMVTNEEGRQEELWHMAINGRGRFFPARQPEDLIAAFRDIFTEIDNDNTDTNTSFTSSSGSVSRNGTDAYNTGYSARRWSGYMLSDKLAKGTGNATPNSDWGTNPSKTPPNNHQTTADKLDALSDITKRLVLSFNEEKKTGIAFEWASLSAAQQLLLDNGTSSNPGDGRGKDRIDYIRGDRTKEENFPSGIFRQRDSRQGDIVNSGVWYTGKPVSGYSFDQYKAFAKDNATRIPIVYVGGNDGMLHGFSAIDGEEKISYVPQGVIKNLNALTRLNYTHQYYVDGSPFTGDVMLGDKSTPDWHTYLVGTLAAGGKGFFILDVTKPGTTDNSITSDFTKANASKLVVMDKTDELDDDLGHIFGNPLVDEGNPQRTLQITKTNNNRWALITGNGYNSTNERPVLFVQYLDGAKEVKKLSPVAVTTPKHAEANQNGLSTPMLLDVNGDSIPDVAYAGDLRGNLWKFDISSSSDTGWKVAFNGSPLFTAVSTTGKRQSITTAPVGRPNRQVGGLMVAFGTGRNLTEGDRTDPSVQTVYSILDNTRYSIDSSTGNKGKIKINITDPTPTVISKRSDLMNQTVVTTDASGATTAKLTTAAEVDAAKISGSGASSGRNFWAMGNNAVKYCLEKDPTQCASDTKKGWYFDLPETGERIVNAIEFFDGGNILEIMSEVPASGGNTTATAEESCEPSPIAARPFRTLLNIERGARPQAQVMDTNGDGLYNLAKDKFSSRMTASPKELRFATKTLQIRKGSDGRIDKLSKLPELLLRPGWRQLK